MGVGGCEGVRVWVGVWVCELVQITRIWLVDMNILSILLLIH